MLCFCKSIRGGGIISILGCFTLDLSIELIDVTTRNIVRYKNQQEFNLITQEIEVPTLGVLGVF